MDTEDYYYKEYLKKIKNGFIKSDFFTESNLKSNQRIDTFKKNYWFKKYLIQKEKDMDSFYMFLREYILYFEHIESFVEFNSGYYETLLNYDFDSLDVFSCGVSKYLVDPYKYFKGTFYGENQLGCLEYLQEIAKGTDKQSLALFIRYLSNQKEYYSLQDFDLYVDISDSVIDDKYFLVVDSFVRDTDSIVGFVSNVYDEELSKKDDDFNKLYKNLCNDLGFELPMSHTKKNGTIKKLIYTIQ